MNKSKQEYFYNKDRLAKEATREKATGELKVPFNDLRELSKELAFLNTNEELKAVCRYNLNSSLKRKGYVESEKCNSGAELQDINHTAFVCRNFDEQRRVLYEEFDKIGISQPECEIIGIIQKQF
ncbi:hypothetical protein PUN28_009434 [Cardiocondyla obscurior]|uniref:Uncharacterized protein n=1 Tax=Cardiocondyla obscurior TaxID=286306 RepID=A0AAW2FU55_9HYME